MMMMMMMMMTVETDLKLTLEYINLHVTTGFASFQT